ncbi:MAG TPA: hypothetical protein PLA53_01990, partial [bacterium]|nr:hypothetical protein [bacterium]
QLEITTPGLAVDIDETLSWTVGFWVEAMQQKFGNPENLTIKEMVAKYRYTQNVPYWQSPEALEWMAAKINSNEIQEGLPLIDGSSVYLNKIKQIIPIVAYITVRPVKVLEGTKNWLKKHNFPLAPVICRPNDIDHGDGHQWKATVLESLYPNVLGIIDDNPKLLSFLNKNYRGKVFLYDHHDNFGLSFVIACRDWPTTYQAVKKTFIKV